MYTLITGATGLVGRYLIRDLLLNGHQLALVVRGSRRSSARERIEQILQYWEQQHQRPLPRPVVLDGDISKPSFGLSESDQLWIQQSCKSIIHSAAILEFFGADRNGEPWRTNLDGTRHMLELCERLGIRDIHYVSTAYVAGMQTAVVEESSLAAGQTFRNDYEASKFEAESLVRNASFPEHVTVYRPAVICGDSQTGYTNTYHGLFVYLRLMAMLIPCIPTGPDGRRRTPIRLAFTGEERRNLIPVDWVSAVMCRIFENPAARGLTFHLVPDVPTAARHLIDCCAEYFQSTGVLYAGDPEPENADDVPLSEDQRMFESLFRENAETYANYETTDNTFDASNTRRFVPDLPCPPIDRTIIHRYIEFGNSDKWGKRRPDYTPVPVWFEDFCRQSATPGSAATTRVGLNLLGLGGSQLTLEFSNTGLVSVSRGLPSEQIPTLTASTSELREAVLGHVAATELQATWEHCTDDQAAWLTNLLISSLSPDATPVGV
ncbi:MAG: SDR family oxidoreductase [Planctomycetaceae bacterium]